MLKNTFPYSNKLKINLHTRLDDGKDPKYEINDKTKNELKEKIKNELEKDLKFEINDKTKNELKEKIKNELEKDLKFEIGDKTKNELKEKIKNELEKDLKFEIGDKTKNEIKDKIKKEIEDERDYKRDKNGHDKDNKDKDGFNKDGYDKDGYDEKGYDEKGFDKDGFNKDGYDKDGLNEKGYDKDGYDKKGFDEDGYNRQGFDKDGYNAKGFDKDGKKRDGDGKDGDGKVIEGKMINLSHTEKEMCGADAEKYSTEKHVGKPAWFTRDLLKQFLPDLMKNDKIMSHFDSKSGDKYHAENFGITFKCEEDEECGKNINFTFGAPSNMWCNKGGAIGNAGLKCRDEIQTIENSACCPTAAPYSNTMNSENFFLNEKCPNLVLDLPAAKLSKCSGKTIVAKLEAPLVVVATDNAIIDKNGYKIAQHNYFILKDRLNYKGDIKSSTGKSAEQLEEIKESVERGLWSSDKEVKLKIPAMPAYSPGADDDQDETFFHYDNEAECKEEVLQAKAEAEKLKIQVQKDGYDEDGFNKDGYNEKGYHRSDKEVLLKSAFSHNPNYGLSNKERHRNRGLFRLHGIGNQDRKNMN